MTARLSKVAAMGGVAFIAIATGWIAYRTHNANESSTAERATRTAELRALRVAVPGAIDRLAFDFPVEAREEIRIGLSEGEARWQDAQSVVADDLATDALKRSLAAFESACASAVRSGSWEASSAEFEEIGRRAAFLRYVNRLAIYLGQDPGLEGDVWASLEPRLDALGMNPPERPCQALLTFRDRLDKASAATKVLNAIEVQLSESSTLLAEAQRMTERAANALGERARSVEIGAAKTETPAFQEADRLLQRANALERVGKFAEAADRFEKAGEAFKAAARMAGGSQEEANAVRDRFARALRALTGNRDCRDLPDWTARQACRAAMSALDRGDALAANRRNKEATDLYEEGIQVLAGRQAAARRGKTKQPKAPSDGGAFAASRPAAGQGSERTPQPQAAPAVRAQAQSTVSAVVEAQKGETAWRQAAQDTLRAYEAALESKDIEQLGRIWQSPRSEALHKIWRTRFERYQRIEVELNVSDMRLEADGSIIVEFDQIERLDGSGLEWSISVELRPVAEAWRIVEYRREIGGRS